MFRINPSDSMTELYGLGKADAQVFDTSKVDNAIARKQEKQYADKKQQEAEQKGLMLDISKLGKGAIRPSDMGYFMESQKALYDDVKKAYLESKGGDLSIEKQVEFESRIAGLNTEAQASAARSKVNTDNAVEAQKNQGKYRKDSLDSIYKDQFDVASSRNWGTNTPQLKGDVNLVQDAQKLLPLIKEAVATKTIERPMGDGSTHKQVFTGTNYKDVVDSKTGEVIQPGIETFLRENLKNEDIFDKAQYEVNQIPVDEAVKKYGVGSDGKPDVANYYIETLKPFFKQSNDSDIRTSGWKPDSGNGNGGDNKKVKVNGVYIPPKDGVDGRYQFEYATQADNSPVVIKGPAKSSYSGESISIKPIAVNFKPGNTEMEAAVMLTAEQKKVNDDAGSEVYPSIIHLPYQYVKDIMANKFESDNIFDVTHGKVKETVHLVKGTGVSGNKTKNPKTIIQNGYTYTLNEKTGQYE